MTQSNKLTSVKLTHSDPRSEGAVVLLIKLKPPRKAPQPRSKAQLVQYLKYGSLFLLTFQNVLDAVLVRHSRTKTKDLYISSSAIVVIEIMKLFASFILMAQEEKGCLEALRSISSSMAKDYKDSAKMAVVAFTYVLQNNLAFIAASHLDVATYQATYQLKLLTAALFSVALLGTKLLPTQWLSLGLLIAGVIEVKTADLTNSTSKPTLTNQNPFLGFSAVMLASCTSGFAGVYFEKVLKTSASSLWLRNIQLSVISIPLSLCFSLATDWVSIEEKGFFFGYDAVVWFVIANKSFGGIIIAMVIKYADNIIKGFAVSIALVLGSVANVYIFHVVLNCQFVIGAGLVVLAVLFYGYRPEKKSNVNEEIAEDR